jgi:hypothetical protein
MIRISSRRWERALRRCSSSPSGCWRTHFRLVLALTEGRLLTLTTAFRLRTTRLVRRNRFDCRRSETGPEGDDGAPLILLMVRYLKDTKEETL